jgi:hypothetical protein
MRRKIFIILALSMLFSLLVFSNANADIYRWIRQGKFWARHFDSGHQSETAGTDMAVYYFGDQNNEGHTYLDFLRCAGLRFGCANWPDPVTGTTMAVKLAGAPYGTSDETANTFPLLDEDGWTLRRYFRSPPPQIILSGNSLHEPFPLDGSDAVDASKVPGTADVVVTSRVRNWMGLELDYKVFAWSQKNHDDYIVWDITITNTGNIDPDDEIENQGVDIHGLYFMRQYEIFPNESAKEWSGWYGCRPGDSLRVTYSYPNRSNTNWDNLGWFREQQTGKMWGPVWGGEAFLYVQTSSDNTANDPAQPQMHAIAGPDDLAFKHESGTKGPSEWEMVYNVMQQGYNPWRPTPMMEGTYPGTHHDLEPDQRDWKYLSDYSWWFWHAVTMAGGGPYELPFGESIRIVYALGAGSLDPETAFSVGRDWVDGNCVWPEDNDGTIDDLADYYPVFGRYPDIAPTANDQAKDRWVMTGRDSLFLNLTAAQWGFDNDWDIPTPPPAPSLEVIPLPDKIDLEWWFEEGTTGTDKVDGFRVYRAIGGYNYMISSAGVVTGKFEMVADVGPSTTTYSDVNAERGQAYYYYVTAYTNSNTKPDFKGVAEPFLESGVYLNRTTQGAHLTRAAGTSLSQIRVVPNPFHLHAAELGLQFKGEQDKILFMNLPPQCTIKIYSESGDLIKTLEHTDGSGDEPWGILTEEFSTTATGQVIVSGIYIAHIETPDGQAINLKFVVVR